MMRVQPALDTLKSFAIRRGTGGGYPVAVVVFAPAVSITTVDVAVVSDVAIVIIFGGRRPAGAAAIARHTLIAVGGLTRDHGATVIGDVPGSNPSAAVGGDVAAPLGVRI